ncbi:transposase [Salmonella enterica subsp. salamae]|nr:transposase [Salmonella enterica subsp. salamae]
MLIACVDGLKGFPDAITASTRSPIFSCASSHMVRNSLKYVAWKDCKAVISGLKTVGPDRRGGVDGAGCVRGRVGRQIPTHQQKLACAPGKPEHVFRLPAVPQAGMRSAQRRATGISPEHSLYIKYSLNEPGKINVAVLL